MRRIYQSLVEGVKGQFFLPIDIFSDPNVGGLLCDVDLEKLGKINWPEVEFEIIINPEDETGWDKSMFIQGDNYKGTEWDVEIPENEFYSCTVSEVVDKLMEKLKKNLEIIYTHDNIFPEMKMIVQNSSWTETNNLVATYNKERRSVIFPVWPFDGPVYWVKPKEKC